MTIVKHTPPEGNGSERFGDAIDLRRAALAKAGAQ